MGGIILETFHALREQTRRALHARGTEIVIAHHRRKDPPRRYLYLHPSRWSIGAVQSSRRWMLPVALPYADDPDPLRTLARAADRQLARWLWAASGELASEDREALRRFAAQSPTLEWEVTPLSLKAAG